MKGHLITILIVMCNIMKIRCKCKTWSVAQQSTEPTLYIHLAAGRLGARISPYMLMLIFR